MNLNSKFSDFYSQNTKDIIKFRNSLRDILLLDWRDVLKSIPRICVNEKDLNSIQTNPSIHLINYLSSRSVTLKELYDAFEALNIENGLILLGKQEKPIQIQTKSPSDQVIKVKNGDFIELICQADGFPKPTYEFYNNQNELTNKTNSLIIQKANQSNNGVYKCVITQTRKGGTFFENVYFRVEVVANLTECLTVKISPFTIITEVEESIEIKAQVNEPNLDKIKFEWFKTDPRTLETKFLSNNPTSNYPVLRINDITTDDIGRYTCQVTRETTNEKIISSSSCQVEIKETSEFDLKIALLIGNGNYERDIRQYKDCIHCKFDDKLLWISPLDIYNCIERLKHAYEKLGYIVLAFVDLSAHDVLRCAKLFRMICDSAKRVSVLLHVIGHGHSYCHHDYLMPIDFMIKFHRNDHKYRGLLNESSISNLHNLLEMFISDDILESDKSFYVVVLWDLCRGQWNHGLSLDVEPNLDIDLQMNNTMDYTVIYGCLTGKNEYFLMEDLPELNLPKGPIVTNMLLNNLKENLPLLEIAENINKELTELREKVSFLGRLSPIKTNSTLRKVNFWLKANRNKYFYNRIANEFFLGGKNMNESLVYDDNKKLIVKYYFTNDVFLNTTLFNIEYDSKFVHDIKLKCDEPLQYKKMKIIGSNKRVYRILNLLEMYSEDSDDTLSLSIELENNQTKIIELEIPGHYQSLYMKMNSIDINEYIKMKANMNKAGDDMSVTSIEMYQNDSQFDTTSNDDS